MSHQRNEAEGTTCRHLLMWEAKMSLLGGSMDRCMKKGVVQQNEFIIILTTVANQQQLDQIIIRLFSCRWVGCGHFLLCSAIISSSSLFFFVWLPELFKISSLFSHSFCCWKKKRERKWQSSAPKRFRRLWGVLFFTSLSGWERTGQRVCVCAGYLPTIRKMLLASGDWLSTPVSGPSSEIRTVNNNRLFLGSVNSITHASFWDKWTQRYNCVPWNSVKEIEFHETIEKIPLTILELEFVVLVLEEGCLGKAWCNLAFCDGFLACLWGMLPCMRKDDNFVRDLVLNRQKRRQNVWICPLALIWRQFLNGRKDERNK